MAPASEKPEKIREVTDSEEEQQEKPTKKSSSSTKPKKTKKKRSSKSKNLDLIKGGDPTGGALSAVDDVGNGLVGGQNGLLGGGQQQQQQQQQQGGGKSDQGTLSLRLDLNLDVEITLKARVHGDVTLALLA